MMEEHREISCLVIVKNGNNEIHGDYKPLALHPYEIQCAVCILYINKKGQWKSDKWKGKEQSTKYERITGRTEVESKIMWHCEVMKENNVFEIDNAISNIQWLLFVCQISDNKILFTRLMFMLQKWNWKTECFMFILVTFFFQEM